MRPARPPGNQPRAIEAEASASRQHPIPVPRPRFVSVPPARYLHEGFPHQPVYVASLGVGHVAFLIRRIKPQSRLIPGLRVHRRVRPHFKRTGSTAGQKGKHDGVCAHRAAVIADGLPRHAAPQLAITTVACKTRLTRPRFASRRAGTAGPATPNSWSSCSTVSATTVRFAAGLFIVRGAGPEL